MSDLELMRELNDLLDETVYDTMDTKITRQVINYLLESAAPVHIAEASAFIRTVQDGEA